MATPNDNPSAKFDLHLATDMRVGGWISEPKLLYSWIDNILKEVENRTEIRNPAVIEFKNAIESDAELYMGFHRLFYSLPDRDLLDRPQVKDYLTMLQCFDKFVGEAPTWNPNFLVFLPFTAILQLPMSMSNGFTILVNRRVNDHFRNVFRAWAKYLSSAASASVLTTEKYGWLGEGAMENMPDFQKLFECDPTKDHWGFTSWDYFFTRTLKFDARPVEVPDGGTYITSACESQVIRYKVKVAARDQFWLKDSQPYSLVHMLNDPLANSFMGGTVYQAILSSYYYHRWHSPVNGTIVKAYVVEGTYFAVSLSLCPPTTDLRHLHVTLTYLLWVSGRNSF
ncbi:PSDC domain-containing protein [Mycena venus]|uniref:PSDC domain-containing protein n=1 Tax=Mycena venus TaxID=2733690 RepID=A0A8H7CQS7_9AGAR|nr:PSDC domain-containing protein [Mycena venus]